MHRNHPKILSPCHVSASWSPPLNVPSSVPREHLHQQLLPFQGSTDRLGRQSTSAAADELAQGCADQELSRERSRRCSFAFSALKEEAERASPCSAIPSAGSTFPRSVQTLHCNSSRSLVTAKARALPQTGLHLLFPSSSPSSLLPASGPGSGFAMENTIGACRARASGSTQAGGRERCGWGSSGVFPGRGALLGRGLPHPRGGNFAQRPRNSETLTKKNYNNFLKAQ